MILSFFHPELLPLHDFREVPTSRTRALSFARTSSYNIPDRYFDERLLAGNRTSAELPSEIFTKQVPSGIRLDSEISKTSDYMDYFII